MKVKRLKLEDVKLFKEMIRKNEYFNGEDYVTNVEQALYDWVDDSADRHFEGIQFNIKLLEKELKELFVFKGDIYRGLFIDSKEDIIEEPNCIRSFTNSFIIALDFTQFLDMRLDIDEYSSQEIEETIFHIAVKKNTEALALDELVKLICEKSSNDEVVAEIKGFIYEKEKLAYGQFDEILEYSFYDIISLLEKDFIELDEKWKDRYADILERYANKVTLTA